MKQIFDSVEFENEFYYDGFLGSRVSETGTEFLLWAPTAEKVCLSLFRDCFTKEAEGTHLLTRGEKGVWTYRTTEKLDGTYYTYSVTVDGVERVTADPYAVAAGVNGNRSMVIDLARTNPEGWEKDRAPEKPEENIIYEIHVKDFTWDPASGVDSEKRGKFLGLCQEGTSLNCDGIHQTGLDYISSLGITHVQLLPVFDYGSVDEENSEHSFNWGYDPWNFNVPEGSYSSDPYHGEVRIRELKQLIQTLHKRGLRVIMDVVYNHTYHMDSFLNRTVPGYYYRFSKDGTPANGSGCGNDTASERAMCAQYILDSVLYWASEYHFDGFRFDLMGLLPVNLMNRIQRTLDEKFGPGEKMVYGEPWRADRTEVSEDVILADKEQLHKLDTNVGAFCDSTRDAVKGNLLNAGARGFVNGGDLSCELLRSCLCGWSGIRGEYSVGAPAQTINYLSCHDDWTLWDRLIYTLDENKAYQNCPEDILRANRLAAAILCSCQGNLFLLSGEEFARTKDGVKNSFSSPIGLNRIDWTRAWANEGLVRYYRGLFGLRKQLACLCSKASDAAEAIGHVHEVGKNCAWVMYMDTAVQSRWTRLLLCINLNKDSRRIEIPEGNWQLLVDGSDSELWKKEEMVAGSLQAEGMSMVILGR